MKRPARLRVLLCSLALGLGLIFSDPANPQSQISGSVSRPFPAIMPRDYSWCRAVAWIEALRKAEDLLPTTVLDALSSLGLDTSLGRLALCAMVCPVYLVTPESAVSDEVRVYVDQPEKNAFQNALLQPERLVQEMFLLLDVEKKINFLSRHWPSSLKEAWDRRESLEKYFLALDYLWYILHPNMEDALHSLSAARLLEIAELLEDSPILWCLVAEAREEANMPQAALQAAEKALEGCKRGLPRDLLLSARIYYVRALAHWRLHQPALAETDLEAAARILERFGLKSPLYVRICLKLGEFYAQRDNVSGMCQAYGAACAAGDCARFAAMLRTGRCEPNNYFSASDEPASTD